MLLLKDASNGFASIGSQPRLQVLLTLVKVAPTGLTIGEIQSRLDIPASTLAHHLKSLTSSGLIEQEKNGRETINKANYNYIKELADFLLKECCSE